MMALKKKKIVILRTKLSGMECEKCGCVQKLFNGVNKKYSYMRICGDK